jgi:hypothetical protein
MNIFVNIVFLWKTRYAVPLCFSCLGNVLYIISYLVLFTRRFNPIPGHGLHLWVLAITLRHTKFGRSYLDECPVRRKDLYLTTHTQLTRNKPSWPRRDSNPQSQQVRGRKPTSLMARPLGSAFVPNRRRKFLAGLVYFLASCMESSIQENTPLLYDSHLPVGTALALSCGQLRLLHIYTNRLYDRPNVSQC